MSQITYNSVDIAQISQLSSICNSVSIGYLDILHLLRDCDIHHKYMCNTRAGCKILFLL